MGGRLLADKITDAIVRKALPPRTGQCFLWDGEVKGFALRVTARGAKSFVLDYRIEGRQRRITLGNYPDWTVQAARAAAKTMKREVDLGHDPMGERHALRDAPTVQDLWERYQSERLPTKAARTQADERSMWRNIILPRLGKHRVAEVTYTDLDQLHRDITRIRQTPVRANRVIEVCAVRSTSQFAGIGARTIPHAGFSATLKKNAQDILARKRSWRWQTRSMHTQKSPRQMRSSS
jgi:hypothetical protein